ncbi:MAG TPA: DUF5752 family protein [Deltaproteobacteria bacterium]|nr:DUF5752 family protein [Deltaproteobacteria bacterium]HPJ93570.1 DUF5752 family protein [Deltaproteobacteria bacterium]HPR50490.1 DUF5752 family protein [Deltaproteobacteria bacterium]
MAEAFTLKDCALIAIATGQQAQTLRELRDRLETTQLSCIYYHFWGGLLRPRFDDPEFQNDFAIWARHSIHDKPLAERLALIDPTHFHDLENLRRELIDIIEERLDESELLPWARASQRFYFVRSQIVVFDTDRRVHEPGELKALIPHLSAGSVFYHFIDARRRTPFGNDDFSEWLLGFKEKYRALVDRIAIIDPYFTTLVDLRQELAGVFEEYLST